MYLCWMVKENVVDAFDMLLENRKERYEKILWREEYIAYLNGEISKHLIYFMSAELSEVDSGGMKGYYLVTSNLERIGDYAMNVAGYVKLLQEGACSTQTGLVYTELLTDFERIGDHALNIAELYQEIG